MATPEIRWEIFEPMEAVEFVEGEPKILTFEDLRVEKMKILVGTPPVEKIIDVLRLKVRTEDGKPVYKWWNIASKKAIMQLKPYIENREIFVREFKITKFGIAPKAVYTIEVL